MSLVPIGRNSSHVTWSIVFYEDSILISEDTYHVMELMFGNDVQLVRGVHGLFLQESQVPVTPMRTFPKAQFRHTSE